MNQQRLGEAGAGVRNLVFDVNNKERPSRLYFSKSTVSKSKVTFFVQISIIALIVIL